MKKTVTEYLNDYLYYNGAVLYPPLVELFKNHELHIDIDHAVGEDVIYIDGKFNGYVNDWLEMLKIADDLNISYQNHDDLFSKTVGYRI